MGSKSALLRAVGKAVERKNLESSVDRLKEAAKKANLDPNQITANADGSISYPEEYINPLSESGAGDIRREVAIHNDGVEGGNFKSNFTEDRAHGTTHDVKEFGLGNYEKGGHFGGGDYSTSSLDDASRNYTAAGADLTQRIELRAERIADDLEIDHEDALVKAREELTGHGGAVMPLKVNKGKSYELTDDNDTFLTYEQEVPDWEDYLDDAGGDEDTARDLAMEASWDNEPEGELVEFMDSISNQASEYDFDASELLDEIRMAAEDGGINASDLDSIMRNTEWWAENPEDGGLINNHVYQQAIKDAGFDSIQHKGDIFQGMDVESDTIHTISLRPENIRSTSAAFDPQFRDSSNLLGQAKLNPLTGLALGSTVAAAAPMGAESLRASIDSTMNNIESRDRALLPRDVRQRSYDRQQRIKDKFIEKRNSLGRNLKAAGELGLIAGQGYGHDVTAGLAGMGNKFGHNLAGGLEKHFGKDYAEVIRPKKTPSQVVEGLKSAGISISDSQMEKAMDRSPELVDQLYALDELMTKGAEIGREALDYYPATRGMKPVENFNQSVEDLSKITPAGASILKGLPEII